MDLFIILVSNTELPRFLPFVLYLNYLSRVACFPPYSQEFFNSLPDMQKFPLRMKDNDLLVTELYKDPNGDMVTALSVYLTPKTCKSLILSSSFLRIVYTSVGIPVILSVPFRISAKRRIINLL